VRPSHPPTLVTIARRALRGEAAVERGATLLVAVSGGPDSMALLDVLARLRRPLAFGLFAHGVDHGLREGAAQELERAEAFARTLDVPFTQTRVRVPRGGNLQARARAARWSALEDAAGILRADAIATAHHADDRAETLLIRLLRGTSPLGLAVLPPRAPGTYPDAPARIRPVLRARRADIHAHLARHSIPFSIDPSNADPRFVRTRVRLEVLPVLERLSPRIVEHLCRLADGLASGPKPTT
jgi:tRNA(Ile)-lysidine synthase